MTEPRILPTRRLNAAQIKYLTQDLADKYMAGVDLGSRILHIREASVSLQQLLIDLDIHINELLRLGIIDTNDDMLKMIPSIWDQMNALANSIDSYQCRSL